MQIYRMVLYLFSFALIAMVLLPLLKKDYWIFRIFDYPRLQKFTIIFILCICWLYSLSENPATFDMAVLIALCLCMIHLAYLVYPFTIIGKQMIGKALNPETSNKLNILVSNVYQENRNYQKFLDLVKKRDPDIVFVVEVDRQWVENIKSLRQQYPQYIEVPLGNTYGLAFYSRLPMKTHKVNYFIDNEVPSVEAEIEFDGRIIKIFGLHPTPPVPVENEFSTDRDAEILMVGKKVKEEKNPCLVIGDMNDVAWSYSTELFLKTSGLLDPRRGRGLYSTFNSKYPLFRWPLDHFFISHHFGLVSMKVENHIGSDHFPISICLALCEQADTSQLEADVEDHELAEEKIEAGIEGAPR